MSAANKVLAALLRDSEERREFFRQCCEAGALRLQAQARRQFREALEGWERAGLEALVELRREGAA